MCCHKLSVQPNTRYPCLHMAHVPCTASPFTPLQVAVETFLQVCECAWEHLEHIDQGVSSIRATCRDGRLLHSRLLKKLEPQLCICGGPGSNNKLLAPDELCKLVSGLRQRGARPEHLELNFVPARDKSIAQL